MIQKPLVSILINNYNKQNYCEKALRSAILQTYTNIEVIFYDDCSEDLSLQKITNLKKKFKKKKIEIIKNKTRGKIFSFNQMHGILRSVKKCKGQIVCLMDSDDFFKKDKVKKIVNFFLDHPKSEILFDYPIIYRNKNDLKKTKETFIFRENKWPKFPPTSCISLKKNSLKNSIDKIFVKKFDDLWFDFRIATYYSIKKNQFNCLKENLTFYRQNDANYDKRFKKYINLRWWRRRMQAFDFIFFLNPEKYKKNKFSFDFLITKLINKFSFIF